MPDIVIAEFMDNAAVASLAADYDVVYDAELHKDGERLGALVSVCRALIVRNQTQVRGSLLHAARRLEVIGRLGVGLDNIDVPACKARQIAVLPALGANDTAVAEYVIAGLLMLLRGSYLATSEVIAGTWPRNALIGREVAEKTLGLVGFGGIARQVARRATILGMRIRAYDPLLATDHPAWREIDVQPAWSLPELLAAADAISLHVPLTDDTRGLIDATALAMMKKGAVLINSARGGVVDEIALVRALKTGQLAGAMLDVFAREPLPKDSVFAGGVPNLILTPHIAGVTEESNERVSAMTAENVRRSLERRR